MFVDDVETARMAVNLNAALAGHPMQNFWGDGARFVSGKDVIANDPREWLAAMRDCRGFQTRMRWGERAKQLPIWFQDKHWVLKAHTAHAVTAWRPSYEIQDQRGSTRRLWLVTYYPEVVGNDVLVSARKLKETVNELSLVLRDLIDLTASRIPAWQSTFAVLLAKLEGRESEQITKQIPSSILGDQARRLIETAASAQVFTGMGNWGDNSYDADIQARAEQLTASLFVLLCDGLANAVDTTMPNVH